MASPRLRKLCSDNVGGNGQDPLGDLVAQNRWQVLYRDALLFHGIAIAQSHRVAQRRIFFPERLKINRDSERSTNFILATISTADGAALVVENSHVQPQKIDDLFSFPD